MQTRQKFDQFGLSSRSDCLGLICRVSLGFQEVPLYSYKCNWKIPRYQLKVMHINIWFWYKGAVCVCYQYNGHFFAFSRCMWRGFLLSYEWLVTHVQYTLTSRFILKQFDLCYTGLNFNAWKLTQAVPLPCIRSSFSFIWKILGDVASSSSQNHSK